MDTEEATLRWGRLLGFQIYSTQKVPRKELLLKHVVKEMTVLAR